MHTIVDFFSHVQSWQRSAIITSGLLLFWIVEGIVPLSRMRYRKAHHAGLNLFFTLTTVVVNFAFASLIVAASAYCASHRFGLLYLVGLPLWAFILVGLLLMDLIGAWLIHWVEHKVRWMWQFHLVHHTDMWVDTTTANRHHPGESLFRAMFTLGAVVATGAPVWMVFLYQALSVLLSQFNHANVSLPRWLDRALSFVIVSPDMHKVHHHYQRPLTDTNYGNIFSIWDRLFGTFVYVDDVKLIRYGLDTHPDEGEHNRMAGLLRMPFGRYRRAREGIKGSL